MKGHFQQVKKVIVIGLFKYELDGEIITEFVALKAKVYDYSMDDDSEHEKVKGTKECVIKHKLTFEKYQDSLFNDKIILKSQQGF